MAWTRLQWKAKLDLRAGFYTVPVTPDSQKFLGVSFRGKAYVYTVMPMGLRNSPAIFSKFLPSVLAKLPEEYKESVFIYQDDILVGGSTSMEVNDKVQAIRNILASINAKINFHKSVLSPATAIDAPGYHIAYHKPYISQSRRHKVSSYIRQALQWPAATKRQRARILGQIQFIALRQKSSQAILQPAYYILSLIPGWGDLRPISPLERHVWFKALHWLHEGEHSIHEQQPIQQRNTVPTLPSVLYHLKAFCVI